MAGVIITESDNVPTKKIVAVLGNVSAKVLCWSRESPEKCFDELSKIAGTMGADAVINVVYHKAGILGWHGTCTGIAVKLEDLDISFCPNCNKELPKGNLMFCPFCGNSLKSQ
jgi:uncharacterized protein YbjQ (UPF0145 family)